MLELKSQKRIERYICRDTNQILFLIFFSFTINNVFSQSVFDLVGFQLLYCKYDYRYCFEQEHVPFHTWGVLYEASLNDYPKRMKLAKLLVILKKGCVIISPTWTLTTVMPTTLALWAIALFSRALPLRCIRNCQSGLMRSSWSWLLPFLVSNTRLIGLHVVKSSETHCFNWNFIWWTKWHCLYHLTCSLLRKLSLIVPGYWLAFLWAEFRLPLSCYLLWYLIKFLLRWYSFFNYTVACRNYTLFQDPILMVCVHQFCLSSWHAHCYVV